MFKKLFVLTSISFASLFASLGLFAASAFASEASFVPKDIRVEGLARVSSDTIFASLPFSMHESVDRKMLSQTINTLFKTGNFDHVEVGRDGDVLVVKVKERPAIASIEIEGNKAIKEEDLKKGLSRSGLAEGKLFKRATLEGIRLELQRQYVAQGRYDSGISTKVTPARNNTVNILITVDEGTVAKVRHFNIVGNKVFKNETLIDELQMRQTHWMSLFKGDDKYSRERLQGDLERLESYYRDRGYLKFAVNSTQVSLSPEKDAVFITINITEGDIYTVSDVKLSGDIILPEPIIKSLVMIKPGMVYSQSRITQTQEMVSRVLGNDGYTFAKVRNYPKVDEENKTVELTFFVDPGKRTYVNRVIFKGNVTTKDEVLRRELRQMEAAPASGSKIEQSRLYLNRLGFFKDVRSEIVELPDKDDMVDVVFTVEEQASGQVNASVGYSDGSGLLLSAGLQQNNFLGSGNSVAFSVSRNDYQKSVDFSFNDPYYTIDGVSRGFNMYYRNTDFEKAGISTYSIDTYGAGLNYSYPIGEGTSVGFGVGYANIKVHTGSYAPQEIIGSPQKWPGLDQYIDRVFINGVPEFPEDEKLEPVDNLLNRGIDPFQEPGNGFVDVHGDQYNNFKLNLSWRQYRLNRGVMPTKGYDQRIGAELGIPGSDLEYYKLNYTGQIYLPVASEYIFRLHTRLGAGFGYGDTSRMPFLENYYAGGIGSVRGYERSTLGPRGTPAESYQRDYARKKDRSINSDTVGYLYDEDYEQFLTQEITSRYNHIGGNVLVETGVEFIFPFWLIKDRSSVRTMLFVDAGNVFDTDCNDTQLDCQAPDLTKLRAS
ncbi:MAG: outer membrane protein assembly factor BamA, partial [Cellvibrionales bacterium]|nr:outer membrane protein assembly factor BamA [Cellvibrionales bacterium]